MATKTSTLDDSTEKASVSKEQTVAASINVEADSVAVPPPGRAMSFEEAKAWALKKYDSALRELAK